MDLEKAKSLLWEDAEWMSDEEIQKTIDLIQAIVDIVIENYLSERDLA